MVLSGRLWGVLLGAATLGSFAADAVAQPIVAIVPRSENPAVFDALRNAFNTEGLQVAPAGTGAAISRAWPKLPPSKVNDRNIGQISDALATADASGVDVVVAGRVVSPRGRGPIVLTLVAINVAAQRVVAQESFQLKTRGKKRRRRILPPRPQRFAGFASQLKLIRGGKAPSAATSPSDSGRGEAAPNDPFATLSEDTGSRTHANKLLGTSSSRDQRERDDNDDDDDDSRASAPLVRKGTRIARPDSTRAERTFFIDAFGLVHGRQFSYFDTLTRNLREFTSGPSFGAGVRAAVFPLQFERGSGTMRRVGIVGNFSQDFGINPSVEDAPGVTLRHSWSEWNLGAVVAWDFEPVLVDARASFGQYDSEFEAPAEFEASGELPSTSYQNLGLSASARYESDLGAFTLGGGYMFIRRGGPVGEDLFPNAAVGGLRVNARYALGLYEGLELFASGEYVHIYYDMRPEPGDEFLAGGALDVHGTLELGLSYAY